MAPRKSKKATETVEKIAPGGTLTFGEPIPFDALPPKDASLPGYSQIEALEANTMINVSGADETTLRALVKKVQRNNKGRKYDVRPADPAERSAGVNVYRIA